MKIHCYVQYANLPNQITLNFEQININKIQVVMVLSYPVGFGLYSKFSII